jgi:hypothetical protein
MSEENTLKTILETLDDIKAILLLTHAADLKKVKAELKVGSEQGKIYEAADGKSIEEIATIVQKSTDYVSSNLSILKRKGLVKVVNRNGKKLYEQRF